MSLNHRNVLFRGYARDAWFLSPETNMVQIWLNNLAKETEL